MHRGEFPIFYVDRSINILTKIQLIAAELAWKLDILVIVLLRCVLFSRSTFSLLIKNAPKCIQKV